MGKVIIEGWLLGLSTGPYCLGSCAPFMVPYLFAQGERSWRGNLRLLGEFVLGRFFAYLLFGALIGWIGSLLRPHITRRVAEIALGITAAVMLVYALDKSLPRFRICARWFTPRGVSRVPVLLGFLIGINVCPPFLVGVARLIQLGEVASGAVFFLAFFAGTSLYILPLMALSPLTRFERFQNIGTLSAILVGAWFLIAAFIGW